MIKTILHTAALALALSSVSSVALVASSDAAYAQGNSGKSGAKNNGRGNGRSSESRGNGRSSESRDRGNGRTDATRGNGNGRPNSSGTGRDRDNDDGQINGNARGDKVRSSRGALASELKWLNSANASPQARANAAPNSRPGQLNAYRDARVAVRTAQQLRNVSYTEFVRLSNLTDAERAAEFPSGGYDAALTKAQTTYDTDTDVYTQGLIDERDRLLALTNGRSLSDDALVELETLLGL